MPGPKKYATHVDIARACVRVCALAVPVCVCDLLYVCVDVRICTSFVMHACKCFAGFRFRFASRF